MFYTHHSAPWDIRKSMERKLKFVQIAAFLSLGTMFSGMFVFDAYKFWYGIKASTMFEAPALLQGMMIGGFLSFIAMLLSFVGLLVWCDIKEFVLKLKGPY